MHKYLLLIFMKLSVHEKCLCSARVLYWQLGTVLTAISPVKKCNIFGVTHNIMQVNEVANAYTVLQKNDIMVLYGHAKDIDSFLV